MSSQARPRQGLGRKGGEAVLHLVREPSRPRHPCHPTTRCQPNHHRPYRSPYDPGEPRRGGNTHARTSHIHIHDGDVMRENEIMGRKRGGAQFFLLPFLETGLDGWMDGPTRIKKGRDGGRGKTKRMPRGAMAHPHSGPGHSFFFFYRLVAADGAGTIAPRHSTFPTLPLPFHSCPQPIPT